MSFLNRLITKSRNLDEWCIAYIDVNPYRLKHVSKQLMDYGIKVKVYEDGIYVKNEQYKEAMAVVQTK